MDASDTLDGGHAVDSLSRQAGAMFCLDFPVGFLLPFDFLQSVKLIFR